MNIGTILQTIIATVLIYLLLSLLASEIQENVATVFELRAKRLRKSIQKMFGEDNNNEPFTKLFYDHDNIKSLNQSAHSWLPIVKEDLKLLLILFFCTLMCVLSILLINQLLSGGIVFLLVLLIIIICWVVGKVNEGKNENCRKSIGPSYIDDSALFSDTIVSIIKNNQQAPATSHAEERDATEPKENMEPLFTDCSIKEKANFALSFLEDIAKNVDYDLEKFKIKLEEQFDEVQKRSSGVFKRNAKGLSFVIGFLVAVLTNADMLNIINRVSKNSNNFTSQLVASLESSSPKLFPPKTEPEAKTKTPTEELSLKQKEDINQLFEANGMLPLGWDLDMQTYTRDRDELIKILNANCNDSNLQIYQCIDKLFQDLENSNYVIPYFNNLIKKTDKGNEFPGNLKTLMEYDYPEKMKYLSETYTEILQELNKQKISASIVDSNDREEAFKFLDDNKANCLDNLKCLKKLDQNKDILDYIDLNFKQSEFGVKLKEHIKYIDNSKKFTKAYKQIQQELSKEKVTNQLEILKNSTPISITSISKNIDKQGGLLKVLFGWVMSGIAISMGAPFWFDVLARVMNVRNAGTPITKKR
jgi:hypothetical protein